MAPAVADNATVATQSDPMNLVKPFYSPAINNDGGKTYPYAQFEPFFPDVTWESLTEVHVEDRGLHADPLKKRLLSAASRVKHLTPVLGTKIGGIDLRNLTAEQKDDLALLVAERGVVFFRDQEIDIHQQLELGRHFGPLHKHARTPIPKCGLEEVHVVYNDAAARADPSGFSKLDLWHADITYEIQPASTTSLKLLTGPETGGDTLWTSGYALYSSLSPAFQKYLEGLTALHSGVAQSDGARAAGITVRRKDTETIHPVVRVHPATGWKSVYVNPCKNPLSAFELIDNRNSNEHHLGFTRRIVGVPKSESDAVLTFLYQQMGENPDHQVRFKWEPNSVAFWDNRIVMHSGTFDFWPATRHALRVTPRGEKPLSVKEYEETTGKKAKDRQIEIWKQQGVDIASAATLDVSNGIQKKRGYND
ncbi:hypothetical protein Agabi119p4_5852 [Agaricus bisporus var. burnettii]|uniref:TauD/TfdA-like domain-containing protein n=1 Tax=Agaricus bisporus var. burnettii TaxID=192524 RepID=A0A8H7F2D4_AGABI|nr:hypothetical protein Agabi119p4_5852 [Agaricus bisporus var. burnettii]